MTTKTATRLTNVLTPAQDAAGIYVEQEGERYIVRHGDISIRLRSLYRFNPITPADLQEAAQEILDELTGARFEPGAMRRCEHCGLQYYDDWADPYLDVRYEPQCLLAVKAEAAGLTFACHKGGSVMMEQPAPAHLCDEILLECPRCDVRRWVAMQEGETPVCETCGGEMS